MSSQLILNLEFIWTTHSILVTATMTSVKIWLSVIQMNKEFIEMQIETSSSYTSAPKAQVSIAESCRGYAREMLAR